MLRDVVTRIVAYRRERGACRLFVALSRRNRPDIVGHVGTTCWAVLRRRFLSSRCSRNEPGLESGRGHQPGLAFLTPRGWISEFNQYRAKKQYWSNSKSYQQDKTHSMRIVVLLNSHFSSFAFEMQLFLGSNQSSMFSNSLACRTFFQTLLRPAYSRTWNRRLIEATALRLHPIRWEISPIVISVERRRKTIL